MIRFSSYKNWSKLKILRYRMEDDLLINFTSGNGLNSRKIKNFKGGRWTDRLVIMLFFILLGKLTLVLL